MSDPIVVPSAGELAWEGAITDAKLAQVIGGLLVPNQAFSKALAIALRDARKQLAELRGDEALEAKVVRDELPEIVELRKKLADAEALIAAERERLCAPVSKEEVEAVDPFDELSAWGICKRVIAARAALTASAQEAQKEKE